MAQTMRDMGWTITEESATEIRAYDRTHNFVWIKGQGLTGTIRDRYANTADFETSFTKAYSRQAVSWAAQRAGFKVGAWTENKATLTRG